MLRLLVSGLGNIGYRHIEALCRLDEEIELYVHSRYPESMQRAAALFASLGKGEMLYDPADKHLLHAGRRRDTVR